MVGLVVDERVHRARDGREDRLSEAEVVGEVLAPDRALRVQRVVSLVEVVAPVGGVAAEMRERTLAHVPEARERIRQRGVRVAAGRQRRVERIGRRDEPEARDRRAVVGVERIVVDAVGPHAQPAARAGARELPLHRGRQHRIERGVRHADLHRAADRELALVPVQRAVGRVRVAAAGSLGFLEVAEPVRPERIECELEVGVLLPHEVDSHPEGVASRARRAGGLDQDRERAARGRDPHARDVARGIAAAESPEGSANAGIAPQSDGVAVDR